MLTEKCYDLDLCAANRPFPYTFSSSSLLPSYLSNKLLQEQILRAESLHSSAKYKYSSEQRSSLIWAQKLARKTSQDFLLLLSSQSISVSLLQDLEQSVLQICRPLFMGGVFGASVLCVQCLAFMQLCEWFHDCVVHFLLEESFLVNPQ